MKSKLLLSTLLALSLFGASCSTYFQTNQEVMRELANDVTSPLNADQLFTIKATSQLVTDSSIDYIQKVTAGITLKGVKIQYIEDPLLSNDVAYKLLPTVENQEYVLKVVYSKAAKMDRGASEELYQIILFMQTKFMGSYSLFELYYNAKGNDFISLQVLAKIRLAALTPTTTPQYLIDNDYYTSSTDRLAYWKSIKEKFESEERVYNKKTKVKTEARKVVMDALDKAKESEQFRNLVAANNRKGAANLLRQYLPWEHMPPFEKLFWETHLTIMADPLPYEDRILIYRGINDDIIQVAQEGGIELSREEALKQQKIFLMSTMMTKNQGTWNRRLRSLTAMYEKFMGTDESGTSDEFTKAVRITNMFIKHSKEPKGSPFLSYTPKFSVAAGFGGKRNTVYFIDPRMVYFNYASKYSTEIEFLLPIATFPDDLGAVYDRTLHSEAKLGDEAFLKQQAIAKLERELGAGKGAQTYERIELNSKKYFAPVLNGAGGAVKPTVVAAPAKIDGKIISFFKSLFGIPTKKAAVILDENSDMNCLDLIQLFWK
jgi:hypothetical protein